MPALPLALAQQQGYISPYADEMAAVRARMQQAYPEAYSQEEQQRRIAENQRMMSLGILGQLSGDEAAGNVGGTVLKNALANRQPHMTERGIGDPLTGKFSYNPGYLRERDQQRLDVLSSQDAAARARHDDAAQARLERASLAMTLKGMGGGGAGGGGAAPGVKADFEGYDPATGQRVVTDKRGYPLRITADNRQVPHNGQIVPKAAWEKSVEGAAEAMGALQSANQLLDQASANPGAFGLTAKMYQGLPNFAKGLGASMLNISPEEQAAMTRVQQAAALEIHRLYGAALSAGEDKRASTFLPNPDDDAAILLNKLAGMRNLVQSTYSRFGPAIVEQARARVSPELANDMQPQSTVRDQARASSPIQGGRVAPAGAPAPAVPGLSSAEAAELARLKAARAARQTGSASGSF